MKQPLDEILASLKRIEALLEQIAAQGAGPTPEEGKQAWKELLKRLDPKC